MGTQILATPVNSLVVPLFVPILSPERFAGLWGITERTTLANLLDGSLPSYRIGRRVLVNVVNLVDSRHSENVVYYVDLPIMPYAIFADRIGFGGQVVRGWVDRQYLPLSSFNGERCIDIIKLLELCQKMRY